MKKTAAFFGLLSTITVSFSSCQVNWFDRHYEVPWWMIAVPTALIFLIALVCSGKYIASQKYVCPKCNHAFYPKWWKAATTIHVSNDRVFKCPHCGRRGFCHVSKENED